LLAEPEQDLGSTDPVKTGIIVTFRNKSGTTFARIHYTSLPVVAAKIKSCNQPSWAAADDQTIQHNCPFILTRGVSRSYALVAKLAPKRRAIARFAGSTKPRERLQNQR
jgi:hypothetical protein